MPAKARSRTPAAAVCATPGSTVATVIRIIARANVAPVQRGSTRARVTATPNIAPATTITTEWTVIHVPNVFVRAFQSLVLAMIAYMTVLVKKTNA